MVIFPFKDLMIFQSSLLARTSRPNVGSSKKIIFGLDIKATAIDNLLCQPPLNVFALLFKTSSKEKELTIESKYSLSSMSYKLAKNSKFSLTVKFIATDVSWGDTSIIFLISSICFNEYPPTIASPPLSLANPDKILINVVLPAPLTPSNPKSSPSLIDKETSSRAFTVL